MTNKKILYGLSIIGFIIFLLILLIDIMKGRDIPPISHKWFLNHVDEYEKMIYEFSLCKDDCYLGSVCSDGEGSGPIVGGCRTYREGDALEKLQDDLYTYNFFYTDGNIGFYLRDMYGYEGTVHYTYTYDKEKYLDTVIYTGNVLLTGNRYIKKLDIDKPSIINSDFIVKNLDEYSVLIDILIGSGDKCFGRGANPLSTLKCDQRKDEYEKLTNDLYISSVSHFDDYIGLYIRTDDISHYKIRGDLLLKYVTDPDSWNKRIQRGNTIKTYKQFISYLDGKRSYTGRSRGDDVLRVIIRILHVFYGNQMKTNL